MRQTLITLLIHSSKPNLPYLYKNYQGVLLTVVWYYFDFEEMKIDLYKFHLAAILMLNWWFCCSWHCFVCVQWSWTGTMSLPFTRVFILLYFHSIAILHTPDREIKLLLFPFPRFSSKMNHVYVNISLQHIPLPFDSYLNVFSSLSLSLYSSFLVHILFLFFKQYLMKYKRFYFPSISIFHLKLLQTWKFWALIRSEALKSKS